VVARTLQRLAPLSICSVAQCAATLATLLIVRGSRGTPSTGRFSGFRTSASATGTRVQRRGGAKAPPSSCLKTGPEGAVRGPCLRRPLRYDCDLNRYRNVM
jgi:hypothetical protein